MSALGLSSCAASPQNFFQHSDPCKNVSGLYLCCCYSDNAFLKCILKKARQNNINAPPVVFCNSG